MSPGSTLPWVLGLFGISKDLNMGPIGGKGVGCGNPRYYGEGVDRVDPRYQGPVGDRTDRGR